MRFFIDRGGTFTDCLCVSPSGHTKVFKILSEDPSRYPDASLECVRLGMQAFSSQKIISRGSKLPNASVLVSEVRIGTTIATNALLERKGVNFAFVTTNGFKDVLAIGTQTREDIFDLKCTKRNGLYVKVVEIEERIVLDDFNKKPIVRQSLPSRDVIEGLLRPVLDSGVKTLAVAFMHAAVYPEHELRVGAIAMEMGFEYVSLSHRAMPMVRLVSRGHTSCADAYLTPKIKEFVDSFVQGFENPQATRVLFMRSDGGLESAKSFSGHRAILSGPAGGVNGIAKTAYSSSTARPVIGFDMGGTSTDVARFAGEFEHVFETTTAGITIQAPQLEINTVAAGGGSRLFLKNGMFVVGPESSGSKPGPVCYRRQGGLLAITDANVVLGRIIPEEFPKMFGPNEDEYIDYQASKQAFVELIKRDSLINTTPEAMAMGFVRVANEAMCRPIREMTLMRGFDVQDHVLASFGGAGGQHACAVADTLGIKTIRIHRYAGILSAVGLALAEIVQEEQAPMSGVFLQTIWSNGILDQTFDVLEAKAKARLLNDGLVAGLESVIVDRFVHVRYQGTETSVPIAQSSRTETFEQFQAKFIAQHNREYGFVLEQRPLLADDVRVSARVASDFKLQGNKDDEDDDFQHDDDVEFLTRKWPLVEQRPSRIPNHKSYFDELGWISTGVYRSEEVLARSVAGPAIILQGTSTIVVEPKWCAFVSKAGDVLIVKRNLAAATASTTTTTYLALQTQPDPVQLSLYSHRFMSVAEQMGRTLRRTAVSVNIKERLDFSCALFSPDGLLVAHAPYIPVHLGSMSAAVRAQIEFWGQDVNPGDVFVSNHPQLAGGSHLPDITVIQPAFENKQVVFWVASRGHHADIGSITPGSMPPHSTRLDQEGAAIVGFRLVSRGVFDEIGISKLLTTPACAESYGTRNLRDNISDLKAQVAANKKGVELVEELVRDKSLCVVHQYMRFIREYCDTCVQQLLVKKFHELGSSVLRAQDFMDDGSEICLQVRLLNCGKEISGHAKRKQPPPRAVFDFTGTGMQVSGNWNAPRAVTYSAVVYCLRCMIGESIPLNEGCLSSVDIILPPQSLLDPSPVAAVVGGNVLTSQRVVDVVLKAFHAVAASQGCMNNLTVGNERFGYYETICGGAGAGNGFTGTSGVHTHMTNTRIGDPEIIEQRFPMIIRRFEIRENSGGIGKWRGGNGVIREIEFRESVTVSILSERRSFQPFGMESGGPGARGMNFWYSQRENLLRSVGGKASLQCVAGDYVRILTPGGGGWGDVKDVKSRL